MKFTSRQIFGIFLIFIVGLLSLGAWQAFFETIVTPGAADIWRPLLWFSVLAAFFFVGAVVWRKRAYHLLGAVLLFLPGLIFIPFWQHAIFSGIAILFAVWSIAAIRRETRERLGFHFFKNARAGQFALVLALSFSISSGYFALVKDASWEELVPRFRLGEGASVLLMKALSSMYPGLETLSDENTTVDQFLGGLQEEQPTDVPAEKKAPSGEGKEESRAPLFPFPGASDFLAENGLKSGILSKESLGRELYLESGREQIAALAGRPVEGDERISDIFSLAMEHKIVALLGGGGTMKGSSSRTVAFVLSALLFLTLVPFGSLLGPVWILFGFFIFSLSLGFHWLKISRVEREQETLEE